MATKKANPSKYDPAMCDRMIELGKLGASQKMIWSDLSISKGTAETWKKKHPDFAEALDLSLVHAQAYWERELLANVDNKAYNSRLAEIALRGQFQQDYRETRDTKIDLKAEVKVDFQKEIADLISALKS
jgi:transposase